MRASALSCSRVVARRHPGTTEPRSAVALRQHGALLDRTDQFDRLVQMEAKQIGAFEAKTHLSELLEKVRAGRAYVITRRGRPIAELRPVQRVRRRPGFGCDRDRVVIGANFDAPLDEFEAYAP